MSSKKGVLLIETLIAFELSFLFIYFFNQQTLLWVRQLQREERQLKELKGKWQQAILTPPSSSFEDWKKKTKEELVKKEEENEESAQDSTE